MKPRKPRVFWVRVDLEDGYPLDVYKAKGNARHSTYYPEDTIKVIEVLPTKRKKKK